MATFPPYVSRETLPKHKRLIPLASLVVEPVQVAMEFTLSATDTGLVNPAAGTSWAAVFALSAGFGPQ